VRVLPEVLARAGHIWRVRTARGPWSPLKLALMHISVDYDLCEGHGQCLLAAPDVFDIPDDVEQVVVLKPDPPEADRDRVVRAAAMCPAQAIRILN
jgi:ferredoxin